MNLREFKNIFQDSEIIGEKIVIKSNQSKVLKYIKDNYKFNILKEIIAIDNLEQGVELLYRLYSTSDNEEVLVSITVKNETESVANIYDSAIADENEIYDLFGVKFIGNKELKRLYMPFDWQGHPLKKDYEEK